MNVYCFDRDSTVDVNPPDSGHAGVPLEWVRYLAHETEHAVWATGNQKLAAEADLPGDEEVIEQFVDRWGDPVELIERRPASNLEVPVTDDPTEPDPDLVTALAVYMQGNDRPTRQQRIRLVAALYPDADRYIAIDNRYLGYVPDFEHYQAWEFIEEVAGSPDATHLDPEDLTIP